MQLRVAFGLLSGYHLVWGVGEETLQALEEGIVVSVLYLFDKLPDFKGSLGSADTCVEG